VIASPLRDHDRFLIPTTFPYRFWLHARQESTLLRESSVAIPIVMLRTARLRDEDGLSWIRASQNSCRQQARPDATAAAAGMKSNASSSRTA
jgi:hypothetical protein